MFRNRTSVVDAVSEFISAARRCLALTCTSAGAAHERSSTFSHLFVCLLAVPLSLFLSSFPSKEPSQKR